MTNCIPVRPWGILLNLNHVMIVLTILFIIGEIGCPPVDPKKPSTATKDGNEISPDETNDMGVEYNRYLQEVVQLLESDADFRSKLEKSDPEDIRTGKVAKELEYVNHHVRNKLDELKRQELERLRHIAIQEYERSRGLGIPHDNSRQKIPQHVDHRSPRFEAEDLRKLIVQTTKDLEEADKKRKESFKEYEMQKEFEHQAHLKEITDEEKKKAEEKAWQEAQKKHAQHPKIHHPGSKQQLEEVWEQQDHLSPDSFNPKTFFALHDLDGNGFWDQDEVKALFTKELDKAYDPNAPEDDMAERYEEMERMREHVFNETDTNRDYLISFAEFLEQTRKEEFKRDPGWNTIDEEPVYTPQEYQEFERRRQMEIQRMIDAGLLPPHPGMPMHAPYGMPPMPGQYGMPQQPMPGQYGVPQQPMPGQYGMPQQPMPGQYAAQQQTFNPKQNQMTPEQAANLPKQHPGQFAQQPLPNQQQQYAQPVQQQPQQFQQPPAYQSQPVAQQNVQQQAAAQPAAQQQQQQYQQQQQQYQQQQAQQQGQFQQPPAYQAQPVAQQNIQQQGQFQQPPSYQGQPVAQQNIPQQVAQAPVQNQLPVIQQPAPAQPNAQSQQNPSVH